MKFLFELSIKINISQTHQSNQSICVFIATVRYRQNDTNSLSTTTTTTMTPAPPTTVIYSQIVHMCKRQSSNDIMRPYSTHSVSETLSSVSFEWAAITQR